MVEIAARLTIVQHPTLVKNALLWLVDQPNLYTLLSDVLLDGIVLDTEKTTSGIRSISADEELGLHINGVPWKMRADVFTMITAYWGLPATIVEMNSRLKYLHLRDTMPCVRLTTRPRRSGERQVGLAAGHTTQH